jgi:hypothetical protein
LHEAQLIGFAYDLEQELKARAQPQFLGSIVQVPNAGLCPSGLSKKAHLPVSSNHFITGLVVEDGER